MKKAIVIDGNALMFRAYYGTFSQLEYYLKNDKTPANAIKLMMLQMFKLIDQNQYDYAVIAFDHKDKNFRKEMFSDYKSQRRPTPEHLISQIEPIKKIMPLFGIKTLCVSGIEADDIIGSAVDLFSKNNIFSEVYSSDNDMLQLVSPTCNVVQIKKGFNDPITYTVDNFSELFFGLEPKQVIDFKAISGDSSDNIPGVKGIGPKTALELLKEFSTIENLITNVEKIKSEKIKTKIVEAKEDLVQFKQLTTILKNHFEKEAIDSFILKKKNMKSLTEVINSFNFSGFSKYID